VDDRGVAYGELSGAQRGRRLNIPVRERESQSDTDSWTPLAGDTRRRVADNRTQFTGTLRHRSSLGVLPGHLFEETRFFSSSLMKRGSMKPSGFAFGKSGRVRANNCIIDLTTRT